MSKWMIDNSVNNLGEIYLHMLLINMTIYVKKKTGTSFRIFLIISIQNIHIYIYELKLIHSEFILYT